MISISMEYFGLPRPFNMELFKKEFRLEPLAKDLLRRMVTRTFVQGKQVNRSRNEIGKALKYSRKKMWMREDGRAIIQTNKATTKKNKKFASFKAGWMKRMQPKGGVVISKALGGLRRRAFTTKAGRKVTFQYDRSKTRYSAPGRSGGQVGIKHTWRFYKGGYNEFATAMGSSRFNMKMVGRIRDNIIVDHKDGVITFKFRDDEIALLAKKFNDGVFPFFRVSNKDRPIIRRVLKSEIARIFGMTFARARQDYKGPTWALGGQRVKIGKSYNKGYYFKKHGKK